MIARRPVLTAAAPGMRWHGIMAGCSRPMQVHMIGAQAQADPWRCRATIPGAALSRSSRRIRPPSSKPFMDIYAGRDDLSSRCAAQDHRARPRARDLCLAVPDRRGGRGSVLLVGCSIGCAAPLARVTRHAVSVATARTYARLNLPAKDEIASLAREFDPDGGTRGRTRPQVVDQSSRPDFGPDSA